jgi:glycosyltransferase involved in cell wall biosynthesis
MKILLLSAAFPPHVFGGAEIAAYNIACLLAKRGHEVSVATLKEPDETEVRGELRPEGFRLYRIAIPRRYTVFRRTAETSSAHKLLWHLQDYADWRNRHIMRQLLNEVRPDQIDIHNIIGLGFNTFAEIGKRAIPVKYFLHCLDLVCFRASMFRNGRNCEKPCIACKIIGALRQANLKKAGNVGFIAPSQAPLDQLLLFAPWLNKFPKAVIKNVPDSLPPLPEYTPSKEIKLAFAGRLASGKGIDFLLSVLDGLSSRFTFKIDILGTGPLEPFLREQYKKKSWAIFHGFVSRERVACTIARADLCCMPSLWPETYGLVTAQALQIGTPVIGSDIGGTRYLVRHGKTGILVTPGDKAAWASILSELFTSPIKLQSLRQEAFAFRKDFDDALIIEAYEAFSARLQSTLQNPPTNDGAIF